MVRRWRVAGVTLIELMVTLVILALLLLAALPFTSSWVYSARVNDGKAKVIEGYGLAKALALRNPTGARAPAAAAGLRLDGLVLYVCSGNPADTTTCGAGKSAVSWQAVLLENTTVSLGGAQTLAMDNTGLPLSTASYTVTYRSESETGTLY
jgi:prepilin-type N-terminal cleavage/methylation domain-containing protein